MLERSAKKAEKEGVAKRKKVAEYVKKGELDIARFVFCTKLLMCEEFMPRTP
jgi:hypothetical protein